MFDFDLRPVMFLVWGGGTVATYGWVLRRRIITHRIHHDVRSRRDMLSAIGLFLTALCAALAIFLGLFQLGDVRGLLSAISLGSFFAVGVILALEDAQVEPGESGG